MLNPPLPNLAVGDVLTRVARGNCSILQRMVVAVDASQSMWRKDWFPNRYAGVCAAATALIREKAMATPQDQMGIVLFGSIATVAHRMAPCGQYAHSLCGCLPQLRCLGGTNLSAALSRGQEVLEGRFDMPVGTMASRASSWWRRLSAISPPPPKSQAVMVLLTDGRDGEGSAYQQVGQRIKQQGTIICVLAIGKTPDAVDEKGLKALASRDARGNPLYSFITDTPTLVNKFKELGQLQRI